MVARTVKEVRTAIRVLNLKKAPDYDLITKSSSAEAARKRNTIYHPTL